MWSYTLNYFLEETPVEITLTPEQRQSTMSWHFEYCPANENLHQVWVNDGFSHCFFETLVDAISLSFTVVFGITQLWFYRKYATQVKHYVLPYSQLFGLQMILNGMMPALTFAHFVLDITIPEEQGFYGYMILSLLQGFIVWPMICILIIQERNNMLPTVPRKGHGLILLIIWTWIFAAENLTFLNILSPNWFFSLKDAGEIMRFFIFLVEYTITGVILILGIRAPGIPSFQDSESFMRLISNEYVSYSTLTKNPETEHGGQNGATTDSTSADESPTTSKEVDVPQGRPGTSKQSE